MSYTGKVQKKTTLNGAVNATQTSITVVSTAGFATSGEIHVDHEVMTYTGTDATHFTGLGRHAKGSTAATHNNGADVVYAAFTGVTRKECGTTATAHTHLYYVSSNSFTGVARKQDGTAAADHTKCAGISNFADPEDHIKKVFAHESGHICGLEDAPLADENIMCQTKKRGSYKDNGYWHVFKGVKNALDGEFRVKP